MAGKWKALTLWIALPYVFDAFILPGIQAIFGESVSSTGWWRWAFSSNALATALLWYVTPGAIGTLILWALPIRRFWVGAVAGTLLAAVFVIVVARLVMHFYGGFEENIDVTLYAFNIALPSCWAGAYAGILRFEDLESSRSVSPGPSSSNDYAQPGRSRSQNIVSTTVLFTVITGVWFVCLGRLRRWW